MRGFAAHAIARVSPSDTQPTWLPGQSLCADIVFQNLAYFVRTHEKALANALQLQRQAPKHGQVTTVSPASPTGASTPSSSSSVWAAALSLPSLTFTSQTIKPAKLTLTPHHLFYLLSRFEDLGISVGPMNVRLENIHSDTSPTNYVSFLSKAQRNKTRSSDRDSIHSVSSIRSVMSGMSSLWSSLRLSSNSVAKAEKQKAQLQEDLKYLYSAFTKIPCLRLAPDHKARLIAGYEEFPFDSAVPLYAFKNVTALEIYDADFRQFYGWHILAENLRSLTVKRAGVDDPADLLINIVLDDMDKRRRRSAKPPPSPSNPWPAASPATKHAQLARSESPPSSPTGRQGSSPRYVVLHIPACLSFDSGTLFPKAFKRSSILDERHWLMCVSTFAGTPLQFEKAPRSQSSGNVVCRPLGPRAPDTAPHMCTEETARRISDAPPAAPARACGRPHQEAALPTC